MDREPVGNDDEVIERVVLNDVEEGRRIAATFVKVFGDFVRTDVRPILREFAADGGEPQLLMNGLAELLRSTASSIEFALDHPRAGSPTGADPSGSTDAPDGSTPSEGADLRTRRTGRCVGRRLAPELSSAPPRGRPTRRQTMERWTFHMIAGPDGTEAQVRLILRAGEDPARYPAMQVALDGTEVPVDDAEVDYEAPEWKAVQLFTAAGGTQAQWDDWKDQLRSAVG